jgi:hypothetical protein
MVRLLLTGLEAEWTSTHVAGEQNDQKGAMVSTADANEVLVLFLHISFECFVHLLSIHVLN